LRDEFVCSPNGLLISDQLLLTTTQPVAAAKVTNGFVSAIASSSSVESPEQKIWNQLEEVSSSFNSRQNVDMNSPMIVRVMLSLVVTAHCTRYV
jgi:hypothetical protein